MPAAPHHDGMREHGLRRLRVVTAVLTAASMAGVAAVAGLAHQQTAAAGTSSTTRPSSAATTSSNVEDDDTGSKAPQQLQPPQSVPGSGAGLGGPSVMSHGS